jgi:ureidoacrylate peracid hydrolase
MQVDEINPARTAMIVVDMQNDFVAPGAPIETPAARAMVPRLAEALKMCRDSAIRVIFTAHVHRRDGCDMGLFDDLHPPIANRDALVDGTAGVDIYRDLAPVPGEHVIKKHRYSGFFGTDLDIILREWDIDTVIISGTTTENCCHATAHDAMFRNYRVVFLSDATATYDYPDRGFGGMSNADVHHATLVILAASTAHVMSMADLRARLAGSHNTKDSSSRAASVLAAP